MEIRLENFTKRFNQTAVIENLSLTVRSGEMMALLGPSGCGKSTTLFAVCGIYKMDEGRLWFGDQDVTDIESQKRNVGVVFQSFALYPHMTVAENIGFPLKVKKVSRPDMEHQVRAAAQMVHIGNLLERRPAQLSGGQQQRVALARALVRRPSVLLLDEPLANLDAKLRLEMRTEIRRLQVETGITAILVTHDQVEAMSMCDRVAIMKDGEILQIDTPTQMYREPTTSFVAGFLGNPPISFLDATVDGTDFVAGGGTVRLPIPSHLGTRVGGERVSLGIRPEHVQPNRAQRFRGRIGFVETQGRENLFDIVLDDGAVLRSIQPDGHRAQVDEVVDWGIDGSQILVFDEAGRRM